ncbi:MAG: NAD(P)H-hydrate dehydratase [Gemmatimonadota bacterium]|nr:bifunctional ADP-dependent NAD(P)H-hydrate dehydratase/NAD(P)H-hydrate epimerase [Gemmatimonadota bacterium]MDP6803283.1 NAD(P)H-hydrate dehydratase [Gemmatimonadota bacterium]MDP7032220.1 NAD(P)H-hydrate dehydratase [Gemmatimonadota bacterium]
MSARPEGMMRVVTASEMREIDRRAIEEHGVASLDLMECAGTAAAQAIRGTGVGEGTPFVFLCGKGNNGGDGFVAARVLRKAGHPVICWIIGERDELTAETLRNVVGAEDCGVVVKPYRPGESEDAIRADLAASTALVDALLGTGSKGTLRPPIRELTRLLNDSRRPVFALDIPTGVDSDTGATDEDAVRALGTITFGYPKRGMYVMPGRDHCGDITVVDLGYPPDNSGSVTGVLLWQEVGSYCPPRDARGHKGSFGRVAVVAGSPGMTGAACLASEAALRSGAGVVKLLVPESLVTLCATKLTEVMVFGLPEEPGGVLGAAAVDACAPFLGEADAVLLGPGLSMADSVRDFVRSVLPRIDRPLVLDADGLNALEEDDTGAASGLAGGRAIITPHVGELARITGRTPEELLGDPVASARYAAGDLRCEVIFKGSPSIVASPGGSADLCSLGTDAMATAGSGDVLAGLLTGILAQGYEASAAARVGVMVHSRAGDIAAGELSRRGTLAGDILRCVPYAWRDLEAPAEEASPDETGEGADGE